MGASELAATASAAAEAASADPAKAISLYREVVFGAGSDGESIKVKESSIDALAKLLASAGDAEALRALLAELRPLFKVVPKAKTAKIVRNVIDILSTVKGHDDLQVELCKEQVAWAREEKRTFLRHRVELRLSALYLEMRAYQDALKLIGSLAFEVKKLDDKLLLVDIHLLESKIHYALRNMPKVTTRPALRPRAVTQPRSREARRLNGSAPVQHVPMLRGRALFFFRSFLRSGFVPLTSSLTPPGGSFPPPFAG
jgi:26S proteasome regulatory subunit N6